MRDNGLYRTILGLRVPWLVKDVRLDKEKKEVEVFVEWPPSRTVSCPVCGEEVPVYDHRERRWRHLDTCNYRTVIVAAVPRGNCPADGVRQVAVPWADDHSRFTALFEALAIEWMREASVSAVAKRMGLSWDEAFGIEERAVRRGLARRKAESVKYIGVDEKSFQRRHEYVTVLCDLEKGCVLDVGDGRTAACLEAMLVGLTEKQRAKIEGIAMDMWEPYVQAVDAAIPLGRSKIVFDKFHVLRHVNEGVDKVRRKEAKELAEKGDARLKRTKYLWLRNPANFARDKWREFAGLRKSNLKVARAWAMKETIRELWNYCYEGAARNLFTKWYRWVMRSGLEPMKAKARLMKAYLDNILTYLRHRITNAVTEGINAKIQWIKYTAHGYASRRNFKAAILFHCGGLDLYPATHTNV